MAFRPILRGAGHLGELELMDELPRHHRFQTRTDPFLEDTEGEFIDRYRLTKEVALDLLSKIEHLLPASVTNRGCRIPPKLQLLVTLRYYATGDLQLSMGDSNSMSQQSVSVCVKNVTSAICQLVADYIKFATPAEEYNNMRHFEEVAGMPGIIGCIDGVLIPILSPGGQDAELYRCRKNFFALNVMAICDAKMLFTNLVVNWPGSAHDSRVFSESGICAALNRGDYNGILLGDKGYRCDNNLFTPLREPQTAKERRYNAAHAKTRNLIERTFGVLKKRFGIFQKRLRTELATSKKIVTACAILHNIARLNNIPLNGDPVEENYDDNNEVLDDEVPRAARRARYIEHHF